MKQLIVSSLSLLLFIASSAVAQEVRYNFALDTHFKKFKTYQWVELKAAQTIDEVHENKMKAALDLELTRKHLTKSNGDTVDLYVGYQAAVDEDKQFTSYNDDWTYGPGWYREGWYRGSHERVNGSQLSSLHAGDLAVDIYDAKNHYIVWRGVVSNALKFTDTTEAQEERLKKSINKLLKKYPPPYAEFEVPSFTGSPI